MPKQQRIAAGEFKARCLRILDEVQDGEVEYIVTKRGRAVARISSPTPAKRAKTGVPRVPKGYGSMRGTGQILGDIVSPVADPDDWTADEHNLGDGLKARIG